MAQAQAMGKSAPKMAKGALPHYADGGFIGSLKRAVMGETLEAKAKRLGIDVESATPQKPAAPVEKPVAPPPAKAISSYAGNTALKRREEIAGLKVGGAIRGPGTGTSDDVPIMASNGEFMIKAAAVKKIGLPALYALNEIADNEPAGHEAGESKKVEAQEMRDEAAGRPEVDGMKCGGAVKKMAMGGPVTERAVGLPLLAQLNSMNDTQPTDVAQGQVPAMKSGGAVRKVFSSHGNHPGAPAGAKVRHMEFGGKVVSEEDKAKLANQTAMYVESARAANPAQPTPAPIAAPQPAPQGEYGRQMGEMGASAMRGIGNMADGAAWLGKTIVSAPGYGLSKSNPTAPTGSPGYQPQAAPVATPNSSYNFPNVAGAGRGMVNPTLANSTPRGALPPTVAAPQESASTLYRGTGPVDQAGLDGIQARQDARDSAGLAKMRYDQEVAGAQAVNKFTMDRMKSTRQRALDAQIEQNIRADGTERYRADQGLAGAKLSTDASRYGTDAQREAAKGALGVQQVKLALEQENQGYDNRAKGALEKLQARLDAATTDEERAAITKTMQMRNGKGAVAQDEYAYAPGGQTVDPVTGQTITQPGVIFNKRTGQPAIQNAPTQGQPKVTKAQVDAAAKAKGITDPMELLSLYTTYGIK